MPSGGAMRRAKQKLEIYYERGALPPDPGGLAGARDPEKKSGFRGRLEIGHLAKPN